MIACFMFLTAVIYILIGTTCKANITQQEEILELHSRRFGNTEELKEPPLVLSIPIRHNNQLIRNKEDFPLPSPLAEYRT